MGEKKGISILFWAVFLAIAAIVFVYLGAYFKAFGEETWKMLESHQWIFNALLMFLIAMAASKIIAKLVEKQFSQLEKAKSLNVEKTRLSIMKSLATAAIYIIAFALIINSVPELRAYGVSLVAGVGFAAIVVGFAAQETISNIIAGVLIAVYQPFRVGDRIEVQGMLGRVEDISLRHTVIKTWENKRLVIPNSIISKETITNYTLKEEKMLMSVEMGISYDSSVGKAKKIMAQEAKKHPAYFDPHEGSSIIEKSDPVKVRVTGFGDSSVQLKLYFWAKSYPDGFKMACDLRESIKKSFDKNGIEIPFPYRTLVFKKDLSAKKRKKAGK